MVIFLRAIPLVFVTYLMSACSSIDSNHATLYDKLGKQEKLEEITAFFIQEISFDEFIYPFFEKSNITRFKVKFTEFLCVKSNGPCTYTGDDMFNVHAGQNINENAFNRTVELLINAMDKAEVNYTLQNQLLDRLIPTREEMLYK